MFNRAQRIFPLLTFGFALSCCESTFSEEAEIFQAEAIDGDKDLSASVNTYLDTYVVKKYGLTMAQARAWLDSVLKTPPIYARYNVTKAAYRSIHSARPEMERSRVWNPLRDKFDFGFPLRRDLDLSGASYNIKGSYEVPNAGVFNPITGEVERHSGEAEWLIEFPFALPIPVTGIFNLETRRVEWHKGVFHNKQNALSYSGVFDPKLGAVIIKLSKPLDEPDVIHGLPYRPVLELPSGDWVMVPTEDPSDQLFDYEKYGRYGNYGFIAWFRKEYLKLTAIRSNPGSPSGCDKKLRDVGEAISRGT